jgi:outer membrane protein TolC
MVSLNNKILLFNISALLLLFTWETDSQVLNKYIKEGLDNNIVLQEKSISLDYALYSLKIARSYFLPSISIQGDYTSGEGGRYIPIPVGDLMNPVYQVLNSLTRSTVFKPIPNENINFLPHDFYDAKLHSTMPIINTDIYYNLSVQNKQVKLTEYEVDIYKRELIKNIKIAYFNYLNSIYAVKILGEAIDILNENVRVNQDLIDNGKGLQATYLRSLSEKELVIVQLSTAQNDEKNAKRYFNFLLNKNLESDIDTSCSFEKQEINSLMTRLFLANDSSREELSMLKTREDISDVMVKMTKSYLIPKISGFLDLGSQAANWTFDSKSKYYLTGIEIVIPIFYGGKNNYQIKQSVLEYKNAKLNYENNLQQLQLSNELAKSNLLSAWQVYQASGLQVKSAMSYFKLINKGFKEGANSLIEFIDARNQLTSSELTLNINKFKVMIEIANLERETASFDLGEAR